MVIAMIHMKRFSLYMAIQACLLLVAGCLLSVMASGGIGPAAAEPLSPFPDAVETAVVPPAVDDAGSVDLSVQRSTDEPGSGGPATDPASLGMPDGLFPEEQSAGAAEPAPAEPTVAVNVESPTEPTAPPYHVVVTPQVQYFLERFTGSRREVIELWLGRSRQYLGMIRDVFKKHGLPEDLAFVAMIESGFNPLAVSRAGAKGLWQFMAGTARRYGLRVDQWVDERYDAEKSTTAAAAYLRDLYQQFGSWPLAKAAYNAGEMKIVYAIRAVGSTDFWTLARSRFLRQETKDFVPAIHAATVIGRDPVRYGFDQADRNPVATERVTVPASTNLRTLARAAGLSFEMLHSLNPVLVRGITPPGGPYDLTVPAGTGEGVLVALAPPKRVIVARAEPHDKASVQRGERGVHVVRPRDTVSAIAKRYGVSVADVRRWNGLDARDLIRPGDRLRVAEVHLTAERMGSRGVR